MSEVEQFGDDWLPFDEKKAAKLPIVAGTFLLADRNREIIYIGFGSNLSKLLMEMLKGANYCLSRAVFFQVHINPDPLRGAANFFTIYKETHSGIIPRCNKYDLSVNR